VPLRPDVQAAKEKMDKARAALRADIESGAETDSVRRAQLIDELQRATDDFFDKNVHVQ